MIDGRAAHKFPEAWSYHILEEPWVYTPPLACQRKVKDQRSHFHPSSLVSPRKLSPYAFGEALTTAPSPFRHNFELSCRSPLTPCRRSVDVQQVKRGGATTLKHPTSASYLSTFRHASSPGVNSDSETTYDGEYSINGDGASSLTAFSPSGQHPWILSPGTPGLLLGKPRDEEGKLGVISAINIIVGKTLGVGAYTIPSAVFAGVGSVGMSLTLWVIGSVVSFCGLAVYLDLGTAIPKSGGERVYLERIFRKPYMLATCMFMSYVVLLGFSAPNAIVLGEYALYALDITTNRWAVRGIAVFAVSVLCYIHARHPKMGLQLINILGMGKLLILAVVVLSGVAGGLAGLGAAPMNLTLNARRPDPAFTNTRFLSTAQRNFTDIWEGTSMQPYNYATALLKVIYCFRGYSTANQVLSEVKNPVRTLRIAAPVALGIISLAYIAVNVAFFLVVDKENFKSSGVIVAGIFFRNLFGETVGAHVLPFFVIISAAGNIAATSFAQARVNEELARDGLLPWSSFWSTREKPGSPPPPPKSAGISTSIISAPRKPATTPTPKRGLLLHWLVTVAVIVLPPTDRIYNFLVNIGGYPVSVVSVAIGAGLLHLHLGQRWRSPFPARRAAVLVFLVFNGLLLVLPWIPPTDGARVSESGFPYYAYPATALAVLASGAVYWCWWRVGKDGRPAGDRVWGRGDGGGVGGEEVSWLMGG
ncbi:amino acid permease-domain-containing protein [Biscogniauxia marginata]|nr:amino acid permease-domain-containing protein [Biscogniauxia marginata]